MSAGSEFMLVVEPVERGSVKYSRHTAVSFEMVRTFPV